MRRILLILMVGSMMTVTLLMATTPSVAQIDGEVGDDDIGIDDEGLFGDDGLFGDEGVFGDDDEEDEDEEDEDEEDEDEEDEDEDGLFDDDNE